MTEYDEGRKYLLVRQKEIERELESVKDEDIDRRSRRWNELERQYAEIVDELERMGTGSLRRNRYGG